MTKAEFEIKRKEFEKITEEGWDEYRTFQNSNRDFCNIIGAVIALEDLDGFCVITEDDVEIFLDDQAKDVISKQLRQYKDRMIEQCQLETPVDSLQS